MPARQFPFVHLDVFTSVPLEGNQLAVLTDARGLSDGELQKIAKEMNLSETTFVFPRDPLRQRPGKECEYGSSPFKKSSHSPAIQRSELPGT